MYLAHYGLNEAPFGITPNPDFFYSGNQRGAILEALVYAVTHGEGIIKVTGEVGSGKTVLCRMLESRLPANVVVIYLVNPTLGRDDVIYAIGGELGLQVDGRRADEVLRMLQQNLIDQHAAGKQVVLLVEEAQAMPLDTLEEIRLLSNLETARHKLLQMVLFGQPELDQSLSLPRMRQLKERISHSFKVPPLAPPLLPEFLMFRMRAAGYRGPDIFTHGAIERIAAVSEGITRRVSILADKAMLAAFAENTHAVTARHVTIAVQDSQFAWSAARRRRAMAASAFGVLALVAGLLLWSWLRPSAGVSQVARTGVLAAPALASGAVRAADENDVAGGNGARNATATTTALVAPAARSARSAPSAAAAIARPAESASPGTPSSSSLFAPSRAWLKAQPANNFTLQLALGDANPRKFERQLAKFNEELGPARIHVFPTQFNGEARYAVLFDSFVTRGEALAMRRQLEREWSYQAQLRTVSGVREEIRRTGNEQLWPK
jgi:MSHA biogenesis protein MshM